MPVRSTALKRELHLFRKLRTATKPVKSRTANLIKLKLKVKDEFLHPLPMNETVQIEGISVTLIDANQFVFCLFLLVLSYTSELVLITFFVKRGSCPGSVIILFERPHTDPKLPSSKNPKSIKRYLHCGGLSLPSCRLA